MTSEIWITKDRMLDPNGEYEYNAWGYKPMERGDGVYNHAEGCIDCFFDAWPPDLIKFVHQTGEALKPGQCKKFKLTLEPVEEG